MNIPKLIYKIFSNSAFMRWAFISIIVAFIISILIGVPISNYVIRMFGVSNNKVVLHVATIFILFFLLQFIFGVVVSRTTLLKKGESERKYTYEEMRNYFGIMSDKNLEDPHFNETDYLKMKSKVFSENSTVRMLIDESYNDFKVVGIDKGRDLWLCRLDYWKNINKVNYNKIMDDALWNNAVVSVPVELLEDAVLGEMEDGHVVDIRSAKKDKNGSMTFRGKVYP